MCVHMRDGDCLILCSGDRDSLRRRKGSRERRREKNLEKTMGASRWGRGRGDGAKPRPPRRMKQRNQVRGPRDAWEAGHAERGTSGQRDFKSTEA